MRVTEQQTYSLKDLKEVNKRAYDRIIEDTGHAKTEGPDWYKPIYEQWTVKLREMGFLVEDFSFSGFWSQGDGASFSGRLILPQTFLTYTKTREKYPEYTKFLILKALDEAGDCEVDLAFRITRAGRYSHSGTMEVADYSSLYPMTGFEENGLSFDTLDKEIAVMSGAMLDFFRDQADCMYRDLEREHEYLTSEAYIVEDLADERFTFDGYHIP